MPGPTGVLIMVTLFRVGLIVIKFLKGLTFFPF